MANRKKKGSKSRYFYPGKPTGQDGKRNTSDYCSDKRLLPRIEQYLAEYPASVVDIDEMALALQTQYGEYARKKRVTFRALVSKAYLSSSSSNQKHKLVERDLEPEEWLERREREHVFKRLGDSLYGEDERVSSDGGSSGSSHLDSSDSEAGMEIDRGVPEGLNMMNNSILHLYGSSSVTLAPPQATPTSSVDLLPSEQSGNVAQATTSLSVESVKFAEPCAKGTSNNTEQNDIKVQSTTTVTTPIGDSHPIMNDSNVGSRLGNRTTESQELKTSKNTFSSDKAKLKRARRTKEEGEGCVADGEKPRVKRVKRKGQRSENTVESVVRDELDSKRRQEFKVQTSAVHFSDVGGCESSLHEVCRLLLHLHHPELFSRLGVRPPQGFLLHGPPGCGKTLLAHAIAGELELPFIKLAATEVVSGVSGESEGIIRDLFQVAKDHAPCVLFVDEVDAICPKRETAQREMERRIVTQLLACLDDLNQCESGSQVLVIGATSRPDTLDPALRRSGRFDREISLGIPNLKERESILRVHCSKLRLEEEFSFSVISEQCPGFVGADLVALVREASLCAINRVLATSPEQDKQINPEQMNTGGPSILQSKSVGRELVSILKETFPFSESILDQTYVCQKDFTEALKTVQPSAKREGFATVPNTTWDDVGALEDVREELSMAILAPVRYPDQFSQLGLTSPPGILLAGPPGCGKTLLAKAIANESGINFISVKGPELLNMYVGESERAVRQVFQRARNSSPCVIFFDELDALCPKRSDIGETNASARVVNQLLTEMDGLESRKQVFVMAATNRPDIIDPAVLRPGRLDKILYVGLPSAKDREAILTTITKAGTKPQLGSDVDISKLASDEYCNGFSGADLNALVREAAITALKEYMKSKPPDEQISAQSTPLFTKEHSTESSLVISMRHFTTALSKFRPSVSAKDQLFYEQMAVRFTHCEDPQRLGVVDSALPKYTC